MYETLFPARRHHHRLRLRLRLRLLPHFHLHFSLLSRSSCDFHFPALLLPLRSLLVLLLIGNLKRLVMLRCQEAFPAVASQALVIGALQFKSPTCTAACVLRPSVYTHHTAFQIVCKQVK